MKAVSGRNVVKRHEDYAFYRPSAVAIARVVQDFPLLLAQVIPFCKSCLPEAHVGYMRLKAFAAFSGSNCRLAILRGPFGSSDFT